MLRNHRQELLDDIIDELFELAKTDPNLKEQMIKKGLMLHEKEKLKH